MKPLPGWQNNNKTTGSIDPAEMMRKYLLTAGDISKQIYGSIKPPPGYGDSINAINMAQTRAGTTQGILAALMNSIPQQQQMAFQRQQYEDAKKRYEKEKMERQAQNYWNSLRYGRGTNFINPGTVGNMAAYEERMNSSRGRLPQPSQGQTSAVNPIASAFRDSVNNADAMTNAMNNVWQGVNNQKPYENKWGHYNPGRWGG